MPTASMLPGPRAVAAACLAVLLALASAPSPSRAAAAGDERHNVLEFFPTARLRHSAVGRRSKGGITISYNATQLTASGEWVSVFVVWGRPPAAGARVPPPLPSPLAAPLGR